MNYVFILFTFFSTTYSFILPSRFLSVKTILSQNTRSFLSLQNSPNNEYWNENINNFVNYFNINIDDQIEIDCILNTKIIACEKFFNKNTNNFFKLDENYNSNYTILIHRLINFVHSLNINEMSLHNGSWNEKIKFPMFPLFLFNIIFIIHLHILLFHIIFMFHLTFLITITYFALKR